MSCRTYSSSLSNIVIGAEVVLSRRQDFISLAARARTWINPDIITLSETKRCREPQPREAKPRGLLKNYSWSYRSNFGNFRRAIYGKLEKTSGTEGGILHERQRVVGSK
jgi:hypothetical protein